MIKMRIERGLCIVIIDGWTAEAPTFREAFEAHGVAI
jgi:hypothetical protein